MGVGLYLHGRFKSPRTKSDPSRDWLVKVQNWFDDDIAGDDFWGNFYTRPRQGTTHDNQPALFVALHQAGEEVEFIVPEKGRVLVSAKTSTVGPGYHTALCDLLHRFGDEFKIKWNPAGEDDDSSHDETGHFFEPNRQAVEDEMLQHLKTIAKISVDTLLATGYTLQGWHMPTNYDYTDAPKGLRTPMGIRSDEWIRKVAEDPRNGIDIYPWWEDGLTPRFYLGRAVCQMWSQVRWRPPLTDDEYEDWDWLHRDLCQAYESDPRLDYPWREWIDLIDNLNQSEGATMLDRDVTKEVRARAKKVSKKVPLIGYRRYPVRVDLLDGWSIRIPGEFAENWDELRWSAWDGKRTVWFSNWGVTKQGEPVPAKEILDVIKLEGKAIRHRDKKLIGKATKRQSEQEDGEVLNNLQAYSAVDGKYALCNVYFPLDENFDWAIETWHSLTASG